MFITCLLILTDLLSQPARTSSNEWILELERILLTKLPLVSLFDTMLLDYHKICLSLCTIRVSSLHQLYWTINFIAFVNQLLVTKLGLVTVWFSWCANGADEAHRQLPCDLRKVLHLLPDFVSVSVR